MKSLITEMRISLKILTIMHLYNKLFERYIHNCLSINDKQHPNNTVKNIQY